MVVEAPAAAQAMDVEMEEEPRRGRSTKRESKRATKSSKSAVKDSAPREAIFSALIPKEPVKEQEVPERTKSVKKTVQPQGKFLGLGLFDNDETEEVKDVAPKKPESVKKQ